MRRAKPILVVAECESDQIVEHFQKCGSALDGSHPKHRVVPSSVKLNCKSGLEKWSLSSIQLTVFSSEFTIIRNKDRYFSLSAGR